MTQLSVWGSAQVIRLRQLFWLLPIGITNNLLYVSRVMWQVLIAVEKPKEIVRCFDLPSDKLFC